MSRLKTLVSYLGIAALAAAYAACGRAGLTEPSSVSSSSVAGASAGSGARFSPLADVVWTGNGTTNGVCNELITSPDLKEGQVWLFVLTSPGTGPWTLSTTFSPSTQSPVNPIAGQQQGGGAVHFEVTTAVGAVLTAAVASNQDETAPRSVLTVSHCTIPELIQGCSPGYWKQTQHFGQWPDPPFPSDKFALVFSRTITVGAGGRGATISDPTLLEALQATGGGVSQIARIGTAAYLSALNPDVSFPYTPAQVVSAVQKAIDGLPSSISIADLEATWSLPDSCPLH